MPIPRGVPWLILTVLGLTAGTGCGADAPPRDRSADQGQRTSPTATVNSESAQTVDSSPATGEESTAATSSRRALGEAVERLVDANTGRFRVTVPFPGSRITAESQYRIRPLGVDWVREFRTPQATIRVTYRGVGNKAWFRFDTTSTNGAKTVSSRCWLDFADVQRQPGFPTELGAAGVPPAEVMAATFGTGEEAVDQRTIRGTTDLALALSLVSGKLLAASGVDPGGDATVPATFWIDDGTLAGYSVALADFPRAIQAAGTPVRPELETLAEVPIDVTVRFSDLGSAVNVHVPPAGERARVRPGDDFEAAASSCQAGSH